MSGFQQAWERAVRRDAIMHNLKYEFNMGDEVRVDAQSSVFHTLSGVISGRDKTATADGSPRNKYRITDKTGIHLYFLEHQLVLERSVESQHDTILLDWMEAKI